MPDGIDEILDDLENQVKLFGKITHETLEEVGITSEEIQKKLETPEKDLPVKERQNIRLSTHLKKEINEVKWLLDKISGAAMASEDEPKTEKGKKKKRARKHRKRYKRLGGDDKWKAI